MHAPEKPEGCIRLPGAIRGATACVSQRNETGLHGTQSPESSMFDRAEDDADGSSHREDDLPAGAAGFVAAVALDNLVEG